MQQEGVLCPYGHAAELMGQYCILKSFLSNSIYTTSYVIEIKKNLRGRVQFEYTRFCTAFHLHCDVIFLPG